MQFNIIITQTTNEGEPDLVLEAVEEFMDLDGNKFTKRLRLDLFGEWLLPTGFSDRAVAVDLSGAYLDDLRDFIDDAIRMAREPYDAEDAPGEVIADAESS